VIIIAVVLLMTGIRSRGEREEGEEEARDIDQRVEAGRREDSEGKSEAATRCEVLEVCVR
jgi:hypothetical protein